MPFQATALLENGQGPAVVYAHTWSWSTSLRNAWGKWGNSMKQEATRVLSSLLWTVDCFRNEENSDFSWKKIPCKDIHRFKNMKRNVRFNRNWTKLKKNNKTSGKIKYQLLDSVFHFFPQGFSKKFRHDGLHQVSTKVKSGQQPVLLEKQYENRTGKINGSCYLTYTYLGEKKLQSSENTLALQRNLIYSGKQGISKTSQTKSW